MFTRIQGASDPSNSIREMLVADKSNRGRLALLIGLAKAFPAESHARRLSLFSRVAGVLMSLGPLEPGDILCLKQLATEIGAADLRQRSAKSQHQLLGIEVWFPIVCFRISN